MLLFPGVQIIAFVDIYVIHNVQGMHNLCKDWNWYW